MQEEAVAVVVVTMTLGGPGLALSRLGHCECLLVSVMATSQVSGP